MGPWMTGVGGWEGCGALSKAPGKQRILVSTWLLAITRVPSEGLSPEGERAKAGLRPNSRVRIQTPKGRLSAQNGRVS